MNFENRMGSLFWEFCYRVEVMILIWMVFKFDVGRFECFWLVYFVYVFKFFNVGNNDRFFLGDWFFFCDLFISRFLDGFCIGDFVMYNFCFLGFFCFFWLECELDLRLMMYRMEYRYKVMLDFDNMDYEG